MSVSTLLPSFRRDQAIAMSEAHGPALRAPLASAAHGPERTAALDAFELAVDRRFEDYRRRAVLGVGGGPLHDLYTLWDATLATEDPELLDLPETPPAVRDRLLEQLHTWNRVTGLHPRMMLDLGPRLRRLANALGRPVRVLEIGAGSGDTCFYLERWAASRNLDIEITGSDLFPTVTDAAAARARDLGSKVHFQPLDALDMGEVADGTWDAVICVQTIHHFTPGKVARLLVEGARVAPRLVYILDVARQPLNTTATDHLFPLIFDEALVHDAAISVRRAFSRSDLTLLAGLALGPGAQVRWVPPIHTALTFEP